MGLDRLLFGVMYRVGFTPWVGHPMPPRLEELANELSKGRALDLGCGTGDASILLAKAGWDVTGADFVDAALDRARANAKAVGAKIRFVRADATRLSDFDVGKDFDLVVDLGCFHGLEGVQRDGYVREIDAIASAKTTFLLVGFTPANHRPIGFDRAEVDRRFTPKWKVVGTGEAEPGKGGEDRTLCWYELKRA